MARIVPYSIAASLWTARRPTLTPEEAEALRIPIGHTLIVDDDADEVAVLRLARERLKNRTRRHGDIAALNPQETTS